MLSSVLSAKLAIAVAAAAVPVGGVTVAAVVAASPSEASAHATSEVSPSPTAHEASDDLTPSEDPTTAASTTATTDAPDPSETDAPTQTPTASASGPDATGPAAFGLCNAWQHGGLGAKSVALKSLTTAAGGEDGIGAYCATVVHPGKPDTEPTQTPSGTAAPTHHGRPSDVPRGHKSSSPDNTPPATPTE